MVKIISFARYFIGGFGLFVGLSLLSSDLAEAVAITSLLAVGGVGILSFVSHVLLHKADAKQIGFASNSTSFQFEVGFANLAFGVVAVISYVAGWGLQANTALVLAYALYLLQAGVLHARTASISKKTRKPNLIRAGLTFVFSGAMLYVAIFAITSAQF